MMTPLERVADSGMTHAKQAVEFRAEGDTTLARYHESETRHWANWLIRAAEINAGDPK